MQAPRSKVAPSVNMKDRRSTVQLSRLSDSRTHGREESRNRFRIFPVNVYQLGFGGVAPCGPEPSIRDRHTR
jgi:hypothetical protein